MTADQNDLSATPRQRLGSPLAYKTIAYNNGAVPYIYRRPHPTVVSDLG